MNRGGGLRHGSIGATPRPRPQAVSAHPGDDRLPNPAHATGTRQGLLTERERAARANIERVLPHARVHVQV